MEKMKISLPIIVEGRYDKSALSGYIDGIIVTTGGFSVFNNKEKQALLKRLSENGVILLTDSDGGGRQIRSFIQGIIPKEKIHNLFIPNIEGKEKRKRKASRSGTLGVEGMSRETITRLLSPFASQAPFRESGEAVIKLDLYEDGLSGTDNSSERRERLAALADLPSGMSANALLEAINTFYNKEEYKALVAKIDE